MKIIYLNKKITFISSNGNIVEKENCSVDFFKEIVNENDENVIINKLQPNLSSGFSRYEMLFNFESNIIKKVGDTVIMPSVSELSLPQMLIDSILKAEEENNEDKLTAYKNFWLLCCLNSDSRVRDNLFWFLKKHDFRIAKSGLFVAYRNVELKTNNSGFDMETIKNITNFYFEIRAKKKATSAYWLFKSNEIEDYYFIDKSSEDIKNCVCIGNLKDLYCNLKNTEEKTDIVYTDSYTKTFTIRLGEMVSMDRNLCDSVQDNTCSKGLHAASKTWLNENYFGKIPLMVLVNPMDVVAVPKLDDYGKLRCCSYFPIKVVEFDKNGVLIDDIETSGFEHDYMESVTYSGDINYNNEIKYYLEFPKIPEINKELIIEKLNKFKNDKFV